jgi:hypothetical protein
MSEPSYDPEKVRAVVLELERNSAMFTDADLQSILLAKDCLDREEEIPRWLFVKISLISRKRR